MGADDAADFVVCKKPSTCLLCDRAISKCGKYFHFSLTQPMLPKILSVVHMSYCVALCRIFCDCCNSCDRVEIVRQSGNRATQWIFETLDLEHVWFYGLFVSRVEKISELSTSFPTTRAWQQETAVKWSFLATPGEPLRIRQLSLAIRQLRTGRVQESTIYGVWDRQALQQIKLWWYYARRIWDVQCSFCFRLAPEQSTAAPYRYRLIRRIRLASTQAQHWEWS